METNTYTCPHCGNPILLPAGLTEFSCMYCGVRMTLAQLTSKLPDSQESLEAAAALEAALPGMITGYPQTLQNTSQSRFPAYFEGYLAQYGPVLQLADSLCEEALAPLSSAVIEAVSAWCSRSKKPLESPDALLDKPKFTLCLVTVPAIRRCAPVRGLALAEALKAAWEAKFPGSTFRLATYEDIAQGFRKKSLCFITTAACHHLGKADDCRELTAFRHFRDTWLANQPGGQALIGEYYRIAPAIVTALDFGGNPEQAYRALWQQYLQPCYKALSRGENQACFVTYTAMVQQLKARYLKEVP